MRVSVQVKYHADDTNGYNVLAEIPGTDPDLKDEVVMAGAHLDSWHSATGATDNADAIQDYTDYDVRTHHTNMDSYDRVSEADPKESAIVLAMFLYHAAMRDEKIPRQGGDGTR